MIEHIREQSVFIGGHHGGDGSAGGIVEVMMDELADVATRAAAEDDDAGCESKEQAIGEWNGLPEVAPAVRRGTGEHGGDKELIGGVGGVLCVWSGFWE